MKIMHALFTPFKSQSDLDLKSKMDLKRCFFSSQISPKELGVLPGIILISRTAHFSGNGEGGGSC